MFDISTKTLLAFICACATWCYIATQFASCSDLRGDFYAREYEQLKQKEHDR